jgi:hypothetical protein
MEVIKMTLKTIVSISFIVLSLMFASLSGARIDAESIMGMWLFDEGKGDIAKDLSGNGNDGELMNSPKWVEGKSGQALEFDGKANYVSVSDSSSLDVSTEASISLWAYINNFGTSSGDDVIIDKMCSDPKGAFEILLFSANELEGRFTLATGTTIRLGQGLGLTPTDKSWHHYASTFQSGEQKLYLDGKAVAEDSQTGTLIQNDLPIQIGKGVERDYHFDGLIDEVGIFNVALTETDIQNIMNKGLSGATAVSPNSKLTTTWADIKQ